jgi:hypothetical protein
MTQVIAEEQNKPLELESQKYRELMTKASAPPHASRTFSCQSWCARASKMLQTERSGL